jgi:hypothetical protein
MKQLSANCSVIKNWRLNFMFMVPCIADNIFNNCPTRCNTNQSIYYAASPNLATLQGGSCTNIWPLPEAVITVLCTHDGCGWHPKHVQWTCRIINRLLCVASRWIIIKNLRLKLIHTNKDSVCTSKQVIQTMFPPERPVGKFCVGK